MTLFHAMLQHKRLKFCMHAEKCEFKADYLCSARHKCVWFSDFCTKYCSHTFNCDIVSCNVTIKTKNILRACGKQKLKTWLMFDDLCSERHKCLILRTLHWMLERGHLWRAGQRSSNMNQVLICIFPHACRAFIVSIAALHEILS